MSDIAKQLYNIAIIAHVDHGKTTLVDALLQQSGSLLNQESSVRMLDSNELERERGITILSKNTAIEWGDVRINIVDTPGHADFGGEVERVLSMVESVLLLVDAVDGPMPQTRFVTLKAFAKGLRPIVVLNKIDRPGARPEWVINQVFELFDRLGATEEQLDFPVVYASALHGYATLDLASSSEDMRPLFETIIRHVPPAQGDPDAPLQMQISTLDYSSYVGTIGIGRIHQGTIKPNLPVTVIDRDGNTRSAKILQVLRYLGLQRSQVAEAQAGDIVAISGIETLNISDTICSPNQVVALPPLTVDEPTVQVTFQPNTSPFAGREGKFVTSRQIRDRLFKELLHNVALRVEDTESPEKFRVSGRGELHLGILIETMRREGYELSVSRPEVILKTIDDIVCEPFELLTIDVEEQHQGAVMEMMGSRRAELRDMISESGARVRLEYRIPTRSLIGFHSDFLTVTAGSGLAHHIFDSYGAFVKSNVIKRKNGVLISNAAGKATAYSLFNLQERARMMIYPQTEVYEGMIVGIHVRDNDLVVNAIRGKQLTNIRASGSDENIILTPPVQFTLEQAMEFIEDDELVEVTPKSIRLRKKFLKEHERKKADREK